MQHVHVKLYLADYAAVTPDSKLTTVGAGISIVGTPATFTVFGILDWAWGGVGQHHTVEMELVDEDGHLFEFPLPDGSEGSVKVSHTQPLVAAPGVEPGTRIQSPLAMPLNGLPLKAGSRYEVRITIDGETDPEWYVGFSTRS